MNGNPRVFRCPRCNQFINTQMTTCKFCNALINPPEAEMLADQLEKENAVQSTPAGNRSDGVGSMVIGGLICLVGIVVTVVSYSAASSSSRGGSYVVAWGAILFGGIRFFKGLFQSMKG